MFVHDQWCILVLVVIALAHRVSQDEEYRWQGQSALARRRGGVGREPSLEVFALMAQAYCVKCKAKKEVKDAQEVTMKNGRPAIKGVCPDCGTGVYSILSTKK